MKVLFLLLALTVCAGAQEFTPTIKSCRTLTEASVPAIDGDETAPLRDYYEHLLVCTQVADRSLAREITMRAFATGWDISEQVTTNRISSKLAKLSDEQMGHVDRLLSMAHRLNEENLSLKQEMVALRDEHAQHLVHDQVQYQTLQKAVEAHLEMDARHTRRVDTGWWRSYAASLKAGIAAQQPKSRIECRTNNLGGMSTTNCDQY